MDNNVLNKNVSSLKVSLISSNESLAFKNRYIEEEFKSPKSLERQIKDLGITEYQNNKYSIKYNSDGKIYMSDVRHFNTNKSSFFPNNSFGVTGNRTTAYIHIEDIIRDYILNTMIPQIPTSINALNDDGVSLNKTKYGFILRSEENKNNKYLVFQKGSLFITHSLVLSEVNETKKPYDIVGTNQFTIANNLPDSLNCIVIDGTFVSLENDEDDRNKQFILFYNNNILSNDLNKSLHLSNGGELYTKTNKDIKYYQYRFAYYKIPSKKNICEVHPFINQGPYNTKHSGTYLQLFREKHLTELYHHKTDKTIHDLDDDDDKTDYRKITQVYYLTYNNITQIILFIDGLVWPQSLFVKNSFNKDMNVNIYNKYYDPNLLDTATDIPGLIFTTKSDEMVNGRKVKNRVIDFKKEEGLVPMFIPALYSFKAKNLTLNVAQGSCTDRCIFPHYLEPDNPKLVDLDKIYISKNVVNEQDKYLHTLTTGYDNALKINGEREKIDAFKFRGITHNNKYYKCIEITTRNKNTYLLFYYGKTPLACNIKDIGIKLNESKFVSESGGICLNVTRSNGEVRGDEVCLLDPNKEPAKIFKQHPSGQLWPSLQKAFTMQFDDGTRNRYEQGKYGWKCVGDNAESAICGAHDGNIWGHPINNVDLMLDENDNPIVRGSNVVECASQFPEYEAIGHRWYSESHLAEEEWRRPYHNTCFGWHTLSPEQNARYNAWGSQAEPHHFQLGGHGVFQVIRKAPTKFLLHSVITSLGLVKIFKKTTNERHTHFTTDINKLYILNTSPDKRFVYSIENSNTIPISHIDVIYENEKKYYKVFTTNNKFEGYLSYDNNNHNFLTVSKTILENYELYHNISQFIASSENVPRYTLHFKYNQGYDPKNNNPWTIHPYGYYDIASNENDTTAAILYASDTYGFFYNPFGNILRLNEDLKCLNVKDNVYELLVAMNPPGMQYNSNCLSRLNCEKNKKFKYFYINTEDTINIPNEISGPMVLALDYAFLDEPNSGIPSYQYINMIKRINNVKIGIGSPDGFKKLILINSVQKTLQIIEDDLLPGKRLTVP